MASSWELPLHSSHPLLPFEAADVHAWTRACTEVVAPSLPHRPHLILVLLAVIINLLLNLLSHVVSWLAFPNVYRRSQRKAEWNTRVVSTIHAFVVSSVTLLVYATEGVLSNFLVPSFIARMLLCYSVGYFIADTIMVLVWRKEIGGVGMTLVHHGVAAWAFSVSLMSESTECTPLIFLVTELSTPFVNYRWFLLEGGFKDTKLFTYSCYLMGLSFFLARIVIMPWMVYAAVAHIMPVYAMAGFVPAMAVAIGLAAVSTLNLIWFVAIINAAKRMSGGGAANKPAPASSSSSSSSSSSRCSASSAEAVSSVSTHTDVPGVSTDADAAPEKARSPPLSPSKALLHHALWLPQKAVRSARSFVAGVLLGDRRAKKEN